MNLYKQHLYIAAEKGYQEALVLLGEVMITEALQNNQPQNYNKAKRYLENAIPIKGLIIY